jgi:hypothetical protein
MNDNITNLKEKLWENRSQEEWKHSRMIFIRLIGGRIKWILSYSTIYVLKTVFDVRI